MRVLVVEDNPGDLQLARAYLGQNSAVCLATAETLGQACEHLSTVSVDVVLLDLNLPDSLGLETLHKLRGQYPDLPVVILTGSNDDELAQEAVRSGAQDYVVKSPSSWEWLPRCLSHACERQRAQLRTAHLNRVLQAIRAIGQVVAADGSVASLLEEACRLLVESRGYPAAWLVELSLDGAARIFHQGWQGGLDRCVANVEKGIAPRCLDHALKGAGIPVTVAQLDRCSDCPLAPALRRQTVVCALRDGDADYGALCVAMPETLAADSEEIELIEEIARDMTLALRDRRREAERRATQDALAQSQARHRSYIDNSPDGVFVADRAGRILEVNAATYKMSGYTSGELVNLSQLLAAEGQPCNSELEQLSLDGCDAAELPVLTKDGEQRWWSMRMVRLDGDRMLGFCRDVSAERQLRTTAAQADRLASVGLLATGVAHEINNPLTYVLFNLTSVEEELEAIGALHQRLREQLASGGLPKLTSAEERLLGSDRDAARRELVADAIVGANRVRQIVRDLKTFSRVHDDRCVPVDLHSVIDGALQMAQNEIKYRARICRRYGDLPTLLSNDGKLSQVFLNLLVNAAQAIDEGNADGNTIEIATHRRGDRVVVELSDTGRGIDRDVIQRVFDPFFSTKEVGVGSGLGLSICRNIIQGMRGTIEVESRPGVGTTVTVSLPITSPTDVADHTEQPAPTASPRRRVLVVDDEPHVAEALRRMIAREHDVVVRTSGARARDLLSADTAFDAIVSDLMMPEVTGMELHDWLAQRDPRLARRMLFVTGGAFTQAGREFLRRVENPRLEKPFERRDLLSWLRQLTGTAATSLD